jgi:hypothetical protein
MYRRKEAHQSRVMCLNSNDALHCVQHILWSWASRAESVGRFRAANRHFKQDINIVAHYGFKAPFVGGLPRQIHLTSSAIRPYNSSAYGHYLFKPVEPKPPAPLCVSDNSSCSSILTDSVGLITNCAIFCPLVT